MEITESQPADGPARRRRRRAISGKHPIANFGAARRGAPSLRYRAVLKFVLARSSELAIRPRAVVSFMVVSDCYTSYITVS